MSGNKLGIWSVSMMILLSVGLANHVFVLPSLLGIARRDAWLSILPAVLVLIPWMIVVVYGIMKRTGQSSLSDWLHGRLPSAVVWILLAPIILLLYSHGFQTFVETVAWTSRTYLPKTPVFVISLVMMLLVGCAVWSGFRTVALMSCLLLPPVVLLGDFVMTVNTPEKKYEMLLPFMEYGYKPLLSGAIYAIGSMIELSFIIFYQHQMKVRFNRWQLALLLFLLGVLILGPTIGAITEFGPEEAAKLRYPAFAQWRLVTVGDYIEHVDFFAIFQWLSGSFVRVSLALIVLLDLLPIRKSGGKLTVLLLIGASYIVGTFVLIDDIVLHQQMTNLMFIASIVVIGLIVLIIWLLSFKRTSGGKGDRYERDNIPGHA